MGGGGGPAVRRSTVVDFMSGPLIQPPVQEEAEPAREGGIDGREGWIEGKWDGRREGARIERD